MSNNSVGDEWTREADLEAYDRLPKTLRRAFANANHNYSAPQFHDLWTRKILTARELIQEIRDYDSMLERETLAARK